MEKLSEVDELVDDIVESTFLVNKSEFDDTTEFGPDGIEAESLDIVEMAEVVEDTFGVHIPDEDLEDVETVGDVKSYIRNHAE